MWGQAAGAGLAAAVAHHHHPLHAPLLPHKWGDAEATRRLRMLQLHVSSPLKTRRLPLRRGPAVAAAAPGGDWPPRRRSSGGGGGGELDPADAAGPGRPGPPAAGPRGGGAPAASVRVNKCFREFASRREADRWVEDGRVTVNGRRAEPGQRVSPGDAVALDGRPVAWEALAVELVAGEGAGQAAAGEAAPAAAAAAESKGGAAAAGRAAPPRRLPAEERFVYLKYWKPAGVVCTTDTSIRGNIVDAVAHPHTRVFPVGRLDKESTGLILLTSDGRLPNALLRARERHSKLYRVTAHAPVSDTHVEQLAAGVVITTLAQRDRGPPKELTAATLPCAVARVPGSGGAGLLITLREGRNRQIRRMLAALGYETLALHRVELSGIGLDGLRPGAWRELNSDEMGAVRAAVFAAEARPAGGGEEGGRRREAWE